ncbi:MAG: fused MFS/spermidine synthase [Deltaproteobacteria bacterium]|nr:fused MFS/spermidine synthase [Deltaproteobacteria bacterium]
MSRFAPTIFLGALLLFGVQPMIARFITPWFGGGTAVWATSLVFFQTGLLGGYAYAHGIRRHLSPRRQAALHLLLLALTLLFLPIVPRPPASPPADPTLGILGLLAGTVGAPYLLLSSTGPLMQSWFALARPGDSPYRLYALPNLGSLLGLLAYPFALEPLLGLEAQAWSWSGVYLAFAALSVACALPLLRRDTVWPLDAPADRSAAPPWHHPLLWLLLPGSGSLFLLATTNQLVQDVASVPFLWVLPLSLYLVTFIVAFERDRWYHRGVWIPLLALATLTSLLIVEAGPSVRLWLQVTSYSATLFTACMVCHGELARLRPAPDRLTGFYLLVSLGGAAGGAFVALGAPLLFDGYWEYPLGLVLVFLLLGLVALPWRSRSLPGLLRRGLVAGWTLAVVLLVLFALADREKKLRSSLESERNFHGVLRVKEAGRGGEDWYRMMMHGQTRHGDQYLAPHRRGFATTYYGRESGVGLALRLHPRAAAPGFTVGVIGLGAGTLAAHAREGQRYLFYELDPAVERMAREHFTYLADSAASVEVVLGDARFVLEQERRAGALRGFDVLVVDAFSSDAIPVHLLTAEAFALYRAHLAADGILAFHISNRHLQLEPVVRGLAASQGWEVRRVRRDRDGATGGVMSNWALLTRNRDFLASEELDAALVPWTAGLEPVVWTDDRASILGLLKWRAP